MRMTEKKTKRGKQAEKTINRKVMKGESQNYRKKENRMISGEFQKDKKK